MKIQINAEAVRRLTGQMQAQPRRHRRIDNLGRWVQLKLSESDVADIRRRHDAGEKLEGIAVDYGVSKAYVSMIGSGVRKNLHPAACQ
jgi:hypothetical protein